MKKQLFYFLLLSFICHFTVHAQYQPIKKLPHIRMTGDSVKNVKLILNLNAFLRLKDSTHISNPYIRKRNKMETTILLDEMKGMEIHSQKKDSNYYDAFLLNKITMDSVNIILQIGYSSNKDDTLITRALFELHASYENDTFRFYSPLMQKTSLWKHYSSEEITYFFSQTFDTIKAKEYQSYLHYYDKKLGIKSPSTNFYICPNLMEAFQIIGVQYKMDNNGSRYATMQTKQNQQILFIDGTNTKYAWDPHDLWHDRLRMAVPRDSINRPVDEGCAYLYGGSWGLSWNEIYTQFQQKVSGKPNPDWLKLYEDFFTFNENKSAPLMVTYVINALIIERIEKEKGFGAVKELLTCGKYRKDNMNYIHVLEQLTGINKNNFNQEVDKLIAAKK